MSKMTDDDYENRSPWDDEPEYNDEYEVEDGCEDERYSREDDETEYRYATQGRWV